MSQSEAYKSGGAISSEAMSYGEQIKHLDRGYSNSQSVVRFLDTKAAAVISAFPVMLALMGVFFAFVKDSGYSEKIVDVYGVYIPIFVIVVSSFLILVYSWKMIGSAFGAISPRDTGNAPPSVLFPFPHEEFETRVQLFVDKPSKEDAIEDYRRQLEQMGELVGTKLAKTKEAIDYLNKLLYTLLMTAFLAVLLLVSSVGIDSCLGGVDQPSEDGELVEPIDKAE